MSKKNGRIAALVAPFKGLGLDPHYLAYFDCFNRGLFFEAHEVLEVTWLPERGGPNGAFYKGLIQLAGAFVHLQKGRFSPAIALFKLAGANLRAYPSRHHGLDLGEVRRRIERWQADLGSGAGWETSSVKLETPGKPQAASRERQ